MRLILALVFVFWQNLAQAPSRPGNTDDPGARKPKAAQVSPSGGGARSGNEQNATGEVQRKSEYDPYKDRLYRWYLGMTIIGVCGGIAGVAVLVTQTILIKRSVDAAESNSKALMNAEQAILKIVNVQSTGVPITDGFSYRIINVGRTAATVYERQGSITVGFNNENPPDTSVYSAKGIEIPEFIMEVDNPNETPAGYIVQQPSDGMTPEELTEFRKGNRFLWICGYFKYRDVFGRPFTQRFCYVKDHKSVNFRPAGSWEYRRLI